MGFSNFNEKPKNFGDIFSQKNAAEYVNGYELKTVITASYGFDAAVFGEFISGIPGADPVKNADSTWIFYDYHDITNIEAGIIPPDRYLPVRYVKDGVPRSFHPKLLLLRYMRGASEKYILSISSRNITGSRLYDGYVLLHAEPSAEDGESAPNGEKIYGFIKDISALSSRGSSLPLDEINTLRRCGFTLFSGESDSENGLPEISFPDPSELRGRICGGGNGLRKGIVIFSPFVSAGMEKAEDGIIVTNEYSVAKARTSFKNIRVPDPKKAFGGLHAKMYCFKETDGAGGFSSSLIIGSSNFTFSGLGDNCELNCEIRFKGEELYNYVKSFALDEFAAVPESFAADSADIPDEKKLFLGAHDRLYTHLFTSEKLRISYSGKWLCAADMSDFWSGFTDNDIAVYVSLNKSAEPAELRRGSDLSLESDTAPFSLTVRLCKGENISERHYSLAAFAGNDGYTAAVNGTIAGNRRRKDIEVMQKILSGKIGSKRAASGGNIPRISEDGAASAAGAYSGIYRGLYENLKRLRNSISVKYGDIDMVSAEADREFLHSLTVLRGCIERSEDKNKEKYIDFLSPLIEEIKQKTDKGNE